MAKKKPVDRRINNLHSRFHFLIIMIALTVLAVACMMWLGTIENVLSYGMRKEMRETAQTIAGYDLSTSDYYASIYYLEASHNYYIEIYDRSDKLIYTTRDNASMLEGEDSASEDDEMMLKPRIMRVISHEDEEKGDGGYFEARQEYYGTAMYLVYGTDIQNGFSVVIYDSMDGMKRDIENIEKFIWVAVALFAVISAVVVVLYYYWFILPMTSINDVTRKMAKLDFSKTCPTNRITELNELSSNINYLSQHLRGSLEQLKQQNEQLEKDILKERETEQIRREFIANASHELKTPIAIIQGYAEGLKIGIADRESSEEYCDVIMSEADKMNNLILRMLEVSRLSAGVGLNIEPCDAREHIERQMKSFEPLFRQAGIHAYIGKIPKKAPCQGDITLLDIVFGNYISNAMSYVSGKKEIRVDCEKLDGYYRISVYNSGSHIDEKDIDKIWIGFYRADKAHSREKGHFGLGLSFVSSIQELHKCGYGAYNTQDGVVFWFDVKSRD